MEGGDRDRRAKGSQEEGGQRGRKGTDRMWAEQAFGN